MHGTASCGLLFLLPPFMGHMENGELSEADVWFVLGVAQMDIDLGYRDNPIEERSEDGPCLKVWSAIRSDEGLRRELEIELWYLRCVFSFHSVRCCDH